MTTEVTEVRTASDLDESVRQPLPPEPGTCLHADHEPTSRLAAVVSRLVASPLGLVVLFVGGVLVVDAGGTDDGAGLCVFRRCTGGYCPGCGLTRAARHLTRGDVGAAWNDHPWMVLAGAQAAVLAGSWAVVRWTARTISWARPLRLLAAANAVALVVIWAIRLTDGSIPRFF